MPRPTTKASTAPEDAFQKVGAAAPRNLTPAGVAAAAVIDRLGCVTTLQENSESNLSVPTLRSGGKCISVTPDGRFRAF
jgi:hypothetical protein